MRDQQSSLLKGQDQTALCITKQPLIGLSLEICILVVSITSSPWSYMNVTSSSQSQMMFPFEHQQNSIQCVQDWNTDT